MTPTHEQDGATRTYRRRHRHAGLLGLLGLLTVTGSGRQTHAQPVPSSALSPRQAPANIDQSAVIEHVRVLTHEIGPRPYHSEQAARAAAYIEAELAHTGLNVHRRAVGRVRLPAVSVGSKRFYYKGERVIRDPNLWVTLGPMPAGDGSALLIIAHYDTVRGSPGAVDNAVAVAIGLELARALANEPLTRPVIIAFTAAEEDRLAGAVALAEILAPDVGLAVSMDLVGSPGTLTLNGLSSRMGAAWLRYIADTAESADVPIDAPIPHRVVSRLFPQIERSDHGAFERAGVPAFHLYHRGPGAIFLPYHTRLDTQGRVSNAAIRDTAAFLTALARRDDPFPQSNGDQGLWLPGTDWILSGSLVWTLELSMLGGIVLALIILVRSRSGERGLGLMVALPIYVLAWGLGFWLAGIASLGTGHPMPWVHTPLVSMILSSAVSLALVGILLRLSSQWNIPVGKNRYLMGTLVLNLMVAVPLLLLNIPELAWIPLTIGVSAGAMARARTFPVAAGLFVASLLPLLAPLDPDFLREAVYNGFWPPGLPLAGLLAVALTPATLSAMYMLRRFGPLPTPRVRLPTRWASRAWLLIGALIMALALVLLSAQEPACSGDLFRAHGLTCELSEFAR